MKTNIELWTEFAQGNLSLKQLLKKIETKVY